jgi:hypothetical protein
VLDDASERVVVDVTLVGFRVVEVPTVLPDKECWMARAAALIPNVGFRPLDDCVVAAAGADASSAVLPDKECWMARAAALIPNVGFRPLDDCVVAAAGADASSATFAPDSGEGAVVQPPTGTPSLSALKLWPTAASRSGMRCVVAVVAGGLR